MLWQDATDTLRKLVETPRFGLITDVDGTISRIVDNPDDARVTVRSRELLEKLGQDLPLVAVVSGRAAADVQARVGLPHVLYVGNHGFEQWVMERAEAEAVPEVAVYRPALENAIEALRPRLLPGMRLEDKAWTLSLHYRQAEDPDAAEREYRAIVTRVAIENGLMVSEGRKVFELRPPIEINKGSALRSLSIDYELGALLFIGDDTTDVDAFLEAQSLRAEGDCLAYAVGVLSDSTPEPVRENADLFVEGVLGVESLLAWLLAARRASST